MSLREDVVRRIVEEHGTPLFIYDVDSIKKSADLLNSAFDWAPRFRNFFAVKALPRLAVLKKLRECSNGVECCSLPELVLGELAGFHDSEIIYTCIYPLQSEISKARALGAIVNLDYAANLDLLLQEYIPDTLFFRLNPGNKIEGNKILGAPREAKFGSTQDQVIDGVIRAHRAGIKHLGLHGMFASNMLNISYFERTAELLLSLVVSLKKEHDISVTCVDLGGGIGIPYRNEDSVIDVMGLGRSIRNIAYNLLPEGIISDILFCMECGRYVVGPHGIFVTRVLQVKQTHRTFVYVDGSATNYPRPGVYGGYNELSVLGKQRSEPTMRCDIVGLLCDNCDHFCKDRNLPKVSVGDLILVHDAGAHAAAMSYDYNGRLKCREIMVDSEGSVVSVHREQVISDYLQT